MSDTICPRWEEIMADMNVVPVTGVFRNMRQAVKHAAALHCASGHKINYVVVVNDYLMNPNYCFQCVVARDDDWRHNFDPEGIDRLGRR